MKTLCRCVVCNKEFYVRPSKIKNGRGKCCSKECAYIYHAKNMTGKNNPFYARQHSDKTKQMLSQKAMGKKHSKKTKEKMSRSHKGKNFTIEHRIALSMSRKKYLFDMRKLSQNWKAQIRRNFQYKLWREEVFKRDHWTCRKCNKTGTYLEAHHIKSFTYFPSLRYELSNGITLCGECHKIENKKFMKGNKNGRKK